MHSERLDQVPEGSETFLNISSLLRRCLPFLVFSGVLLASKLFLKVDEGLQSFTNVLQCSDALSCFPIDCERFI